MKVFDMHCDTLLRCLESNQTESLISNDFHVSFENMKRGHYLAQVFACFVDTGTTNSPYELCNKMIDQFYLDVEGSDDVRFAGNYDDLMDNIKDNKLTAMLSIEEGAAIEGSLEKLKHFYNRGIRFITLTWNYENEIGYPNYKYEHQHKGLKPFGIETVEAMNDLGIIVDVSHLSDAGFYDVLKVSKKPFVATHSNSRSLHEHPRNLTDDMIKQLGNTGGVTGINYVAGFLGNHDLARAEDVVQQMKHIVDKGGIEVCSIGSDFDGCKTPELKLQDAAHVPYLLDLMSKEFTDDEIDQITYKNIMRVIKETL
ncbi:dipeptidase [Haloplasma contractile]|uniref:Dipeptidase family protein n=1 Tax=Haloplasma contractile SSD-17B TaxID=1033810 RepID=U2DXF7_9MOLU|nr:dipeptidase [Haloplasma contractile]ERJ12977.1 Dipeptidase family protein [Haloplasma contractile SSD-17B]